jgi:hypothetical protein
MRALLSAYVGAGNKVPEALLGDPDTLDFRLDERDSRPHDRRTWLTAALADELMLRAAEARLHAAEGRPERARQALQAGFVPAAAFACAPNSPDYGFGLRLAGSWLEAVEQSLQLCRFSPEGVRDLRGRVDWLSRRLSLQTALLGDRTSALERSSRGHSAAAPLVPWYSSLLSGHRRSRLARLRLRYCEVADEALAALAVPIRARLKRLPQIRRLAEAAQAAEVGGATVSWRPDETLRYDAMVRTRLAVAHVGLAVEEFRLDSGHWPASLDGLVPDYLEAVPEDPYAPPGSRLSYRFDERGAVVYSVGEDRSDEGGATYYEARGPGSPVSRDVPYDIRFLILEPALRGARTQTFAEDVQLLRLTRQDLLDAGFTEQQLSELESQD